MDDIMNTSDFYQSFVDIEMSTMGFLDETNSITEDWNKHMNMSSTQTPSLNTNQGFSPVLATVRVLLAVFAVIGNAATMMTIFRNRQLWKPTYFFICNACLYDFIYGSLVAPTYIATRQVVITSSAIELGCTLKGVLIGLITVGGTSSMLLLAIDRVVYILMPLRYFNLVTDAFSTMLIATAGLSSLAFSIGIYWNNLMTIGYTCLPTVFLKKTESFTAFSYVLVLAIVTLVLHCVVGVIAYQQGKKMHQRSGFEKSITDSRSHQRESRAIKDKQSEIEVKREELSDSRVGVNEQIESRVQTVNNHQSGPAVEQKNGNEEHINLGQVEQHTYPESKPVLINRSSNESIKMTNESSVPQLTTNGKEDRKMKSSKRHFLPCRDQKNLRTDHSENEKVNDFHGINELPLENSEIIEAEMGSGNSIEEIKSWQLAFTDEDTFTHSQNQLAKRRSSEFLNCKKGTSSLNEAVRHKRTPEKVEQTQKVISDSTNGGDVVENLQLNNIYETVHKALERSLSMKMQDVFKVVDANSDVSTSNQGPLKPDKKKSPAVITPSIDNKKASFKEDEPNRTVSQKSTSFQMRITRMLLLVVALFLISYFPLTIYTFVFTFNPRLYSNGLYMWLTSLWHINTGINPFVYFYFYREFRNLAIKKSRVSPSIA